MRIKKENEMFLDMEDEENDSKPVELPVSEKYRRNRKRSSKLNPSEHEETYFDEYLSKAKKVLGFSKVKKEKGADKV